MYPSTELLPDRSILPLVWNLLSSCSRLCTWVWLACWDSFFQCPTSLYRTWDYKFLFYWIWHFCFDFVYSFIQYILIIISLPYTSPSPSSRHPPRPQEPFPPPDPSLLLQKTAGLSRIWTRYTKTRHKPSQPSRMIKRS